MKNQPGTGMAPKRGGKEKEDKQTSRLSFSKVQSQVILHHEMLLSICRR